MSEPGITAEVAPDGRAERVTLVRVPVAVTLVNLALSANNLLVAATLYALTGSASNFALVLVSDFAISAVVQLAAGHLVDRFGARRLALLSQLCACGALALEAVGAVLSNGLPVILTGAILVSVMRALYRAGMFALTPRLVTRENLSLMNARINGAFQVGLLAGSPLGALLTKVHPLSAGFGALVVGFLLSSLVLRTLPRDEFSAAGHGKIGMAEGIRELWAQRGLLTHVVLCSGDYVSLSLLSLLIVPLVHVRFNGDTTVLALINGAIPVGVILSSMLPWRRQKRSLTLPMILGAMTSLTVTFVALTFDPPLIGTIIAVALLGLLAGSSQTLFMTALQLRTPRHLLGRVGSLRLFFASALAAPTLAVASYSIDSGVNNALWFCVGVEALYLVLVFIVSRRRLLGASLLSASVDAATADGAVPRSDPATTESRSDNAR